MVPTARTWWEQLRVKQKVWAVVLVLCVPLIAALVVHFTLIQQLISVQREFNRVLLASDQADILHRLAVDIQGSFRGYLLTGQSEFLKPMVEADAKLAATIARTIELIESIPELSTDIRNVSTRLSDLLETKRRLIRDFDAGRSAEVLEYVRSGKGIALSDAIRGDLRDIQDRLDRHLKTLEARESRLAREALWGLLLAVIGGLAFGLLGARLLARSIVRPLTVLRSSVAQLDQIAETSAPIRIPVRSHDEIGQLARVYEEMAGHIQRHIRELEAINIIGNEINTIGPDGLEGVLSRITDRAADMLDVDVCLVMLRDDHMQCWVVEAASGSWQEKLYKSVMLWDEFPIVVQAVETRKPAVGEDLRSDRRPEVTRRNLMGQSMLAIPLMSGERPFGALVLLLDRKVHGSDWNIRLAKGFADEAAIAISNARLFEAAAQKGKGLESRLKHLEHLAETLAHDLKGPGERMEELASLLLAEYGTKRVLDERAIRWLTWMSSYGKDLIQRVENILEVASLGSGQDPVEAVDPASIVNEVLTARAEELRERRVQVQTAFAMQEVPCHRAYLRQIFDNLISNAIKFCGDQPDPAIQIVAKRHGNGLCFSVSDNGPGIPPEYRERVFDPFTRLNPDLSKGSGIGLTIVKRIVELYGGNVWVADDGPPGCTISFTLPALGDLHVQLPVATEREEQSSLMGHKERKA